jgi:hypothetical protein
MKNAKKVRLLDDVDDGFNYFYGGRLEETNTDDTHYIKAFMDYIFHLECEVDRQARIIRNK